MSEQDQKTMGRRQVGNVSTLGSTQLHLRNPWIIAWWSAAFPGLGHLLLEKYLRGFLLFFLEVIINHRSHINRAIYYSFIGDFSKSKELLNKEWLLLYMGIYIFSIWDSYRITVDINNLNKLARREDAYIKSFNINSLEINYLDKRMPVHGLIWSLLMPGCGQLYINRIIVGTFIIIWWIVIVYMSKLLPAIHYSFLGQNEEAKSIVDIHWFLNYPSVYLFPAYDAYVNAVENNKLYDWAQSKFLKNQYQYEKFHMPVESGKCRSENMYVVGTFEYSNYLEMAITEIQMKGLPKERILAIPLDKRGESRRLFDTMHYADGLSLIDLSAVLGTVFMVLGSIYGFQWQWGPIWWGLIGLGIGCGLGLIIKLFTTKKSSNNRQKSNKQSEVVMIIECDKDELEMVKGILWENHALGVSKLDFAANKV